MNIPSILKIKGVVAGIIVAMATIIGVGARILGGEPNSPLEQCAEAVIDYELGLPQGTVQLSPKQ